MVALPFLASSPGSSTLSFSTHIMHSLVRSCDLRALADVYVPADDGPNGVS